MEIEYLRQFRLLAKCLNFSVAADSLFITQPTLSRHIAFIEETIGAKLFDRTTQSVKLTPAGELFYKKVEDMLSIYDNAVSDVRILNEGYKDSLRIGIPYYAMQDYLGSVPENFEHTYPDVKLQYSTGNPYEVLQLLYNDKVDLVIMPRPFFHDGDAKDLIDDELFDERFGVLLNRENPLAAKKELSLIDLKDQPFATVDNPYHITMWHQISSLCVKAGFTPRDPAVFNQITSLIMGVRRGDVISVGGHHMRCHENQSIVYRPLLDADAYRPVCMFRKKNNTSSLIRKFKRMYQNYSER